MRHFYPLPPRQHIPCSEGGFITVPWTSAEALRDMLEGGWFDNTAQFASRKDADEVREAQRLLEEWKV